MAVSKYFHATQLNIHYCGARGLRHFLLLTEDRLFGGCRNRTVVLGVKHYPPALGYGAIYDSDQIIIKFPYY